MNNLPEIKSKSPDNQIVKQRFEHDSFKVETQKIFLYRNSRFQALLRFFRKISVKKPPEPESFFEGETKNNL